MVFCVNKSAKEVLKNGEILTIDGISKNSNGKNFSRLIRRVLANSVSLSKIGEKRCFQNIVSNSTEIVYVFDIKHGLSHEFCIKKDSFEFDNSKLNKDEQLKLAIRKLESKMNKESENIVSVPNGRE